MTNVALGSEDPFNEFYFQYEPASDPNHIYVVVNLGDLEFPEKIQLDNARIYAPSTLGTIQYHTAENQEPQGIRLDIGKKAVFDSLGSEELDSHLEQLLPDILRRIAVGYEEGRDRLHRKGKINPGS